MPNIESAIIYIREYQVGRESLSAVTPAPEDYDDQVVALRDTLMDNLETAGFPNLPAAISAIAEVYPPSCGECHDCCGVYMSDCEGWDASTGRCRTGMTPDKCIYVDCLDRMERNWPGGDA